MTAEVISKAFAVVAVILVVLGTCSVQEFEYETRDPSVYFSEYVEGSSYNKAVEIYNGTSKTVDLSDYRIRIYFNGDKQPDAVVTLPEQDLSPDAVFVVGHSSFDKPSKCDYLNGNLKFNGNDAVELAKRDNTVDCIGRIGENPGTEWKHGKESTQDETLRRRERVVGGDDDGKDKFDVSYEWETAGKDRFSGLGER